MARATSFVRWCHTASMRRACRSFTPPG